MRALAFSGGKDSWACLWLERDLENLHVIWVDTGKNYPELLKTIEKAKALCKNFHEVRVDRDLQNEAAGIPSDVVPVNWTTEGQWFTTSKGFKVQSYLNCCLQNLALPLLQKAKSLGVKELVCGQRDEEGHKGIARDGDIVDGIKRLHPIESWTEGQVMTFLKSKMELPEHFRFKHSSMDCYDCTAYRSESHDRISHTKKSHPGFYEEFLKRDTLLKISLTEGLKAYDAVF